MWKRKSGMRSAATSFATDCFTLQDRDGSAVNLIGSGNVGVFDDGVLDMIRRAMLSHRVGAWPM